MHFLLETSTLLLVTVFFPAVALVLMGLNVFWTQLKDPIIQLLESTPNSVALVALALLTIAMITLCVLYRKENNQKSDLKKLTKSSFPDHLSKNDKNELMLNNIKNWK